MSANETSAVARHVAYYVAKARALSDNPVDIIKATEFALKRIKIAAEWIGLTNRAAARAPAINAIPFDTHVKHLWYGDLIVGAMKNVYGDTL